MVRIYLVLAGALALVGSAVAATGVPGAVLGAPAVAGHTTFVTLEILPALPTPMFGLAVCKHKVDVPLLTDLLASLGSCRGDLGGVYATPSIYAPPGRGVVLEPTGRERVHGDPVGAAWTTIEYAFPQPDGTLGLTYGVATGEVTWHPRTEEEYNFVLALPVSPAGWDSLRLTPGPAPR